MRKLIRHIKHKVGKVKANLPKNAPKLSQEEQDVINSLSSLPPGLAEAIMRGAVDSTAEDPEPDPGMDAPELVGAYKGAAADDFPDDDSGI